MKLAGIIKKVFGTRAGNNGFHTDAEYSYLKRRVDFLEKLLEEKTHCVDKAKSIFLKNLYHEIRTPLNAIVGFSDLIELNSISEQEKSTYVAHIRDSSKDFLRKMDNIIEASIIEAGLLKISQDETCLYELMTETYAYFSIQKHIVDKSVALLLNVPEELKTLTVTCDSYRLTQILSNLLSNAFKFTEQGIIEYGFNLHRDELEFFVKDSGMGGLEGKEDVVFENFTKLDETDNAQEGLGLGLGLAKKLIELMGGSIWYKSKAGQGTVFYFTLPYKPITVHASDNADNARDKVIVPNFRNSIRRSVVL